MHKTLLAVVVLSGASTPTRLAAQFQTLETRNLRLIYTSPLQSYLVPQVSRSFQNSLQFYCRLYDYTPRGKITVLLHDLWHYGNAGARPLPENHITVGIEPYSHEYESAPAPETKPPQPTPMPLPGGSAPRLASQPVAARACARVALNSHDDTSRPLQVTVSGAIAFLSADISLTSASPDNFPVRA